MAVPVNVNLWYLKRFNIFEEFGPEEMEALVHITHMGKVPASQPLYLPDDPSDKVYLLKEGKVKVSKVSEDGNQVTHAILEQGEIFGELALVDEGPQGTVAETLDDTFIWQVGRGDLQKLLEKKPDLALRVTKLIGMQRKVIKTKVVDLVFRDVSSRLAKLLLKLAATYGTRTRRGTRINVKLTHQELANLIGSTSETTTATLKELRMHGLIDTDKRRFIVVDRSGLAALAA
jgi:CRP-like cAMP-binding protein